MDLEKAPTHREYDLQVKNGGSDRKKSLVKTGQSGVLTKITELQKRK
jgi:hypothetical protein